MKLHGMPLSNYFCMTKHAVLAKGLPCEFVTVRPSQDPDFLARSPMGKVPVLETEFGFLSETDAILDYLEESFPQRPLLPAPAFARAKVRQLMKVQELYVEGPVHQLIGALFGRPLPEQLLVETQPAVRKGLAALGRLVHVSPWLQGETLTLADIFVFYSFTLGNRLADLVYGWDLLQEVPGLAAWYERFAALDITQQVLADHRQAVEERLLRSRG